MSRLVRSICSMIKMRVSDPRQGAHERGYLLRKNVATYCEKKQLGLCGSCDTYCMDREIMTEEAIHRQFREEEGWRRWVYLMASALS